MHISTLIKSLLSRHSVVLFILLGLSLWMDFSADAQCVRIRDRRRNNSWTLSPKKDFRCLSAGQSPITPFTITFETPVSNVTINWGDSLPVFYAGPLTTVTRSYKAAGIFSYIITQAGCASQIKGFYVNDYNTSCPGVGWIAPPNDSARCLPDTVILKNLSPGMNGFTEWIVNWGDKSRDTADYPSFNKEYKHQYRAGQKLCNATISITYRNTCNIIPCGQALGGTFGPYRFMERDSAIVDYPFINICAATDVKIKDMSKLNCRDTAARQVSWTALDGFNQPLPNPGNGIYRPRGPIGNQMITIPAIMFSVVPPDSVFKIRMRIKNKCGEDTAEVNIRVIPVAAPVFSISNSGSCVGTPIQFVNNTVDPSGLVKYVWDFGDGTFDSSNVVPVEHVYLVGGNYTVTLKAKTIGFGTQICEKIISNPLFIKPAVLPFIRVSPGKIGCETLTAIIKNKSLNPENAIWKGWELGGFPLVTAGSTYFPGPISSDPAQANILSTNPIDSSSIVQFLQHGLYVIKLKAQSTGCQEFFGTDTVRVYPSAKLRWSLSSLNLCQYEPFSVRDSSKVLSVEDRGLGSNYNHLEWKLQIGSDSTLTSQAPIITNFDSPSQTNRINFFSFKNAGTFWVKLSVKAGNGCYKTDSIQVTVKPSSKPNFSITKVGCDNSNLILNNLTIENADKYIYKIYKGNGIVLGQEFAQFVRTDKNQQSVFLPYAPPGDSTFYYIVLTAITVTNGDSCVITSAPQVAKISPTPVPGLAIQPASDGCSPFSNVTVLNTSINLPQSGNVVFNWVLGTIGTFQGPNPPQVTFVNNTNVNKRDTVKICVETGGGCSFCAEKVVITYPSPKATIILPDSICSGTSVQIAANTVGAVSHLWEFIDYDGSTSNQTTFSKVFNNQSNIPKLFKVGLIVRSQSNCPFWTEKYIKVNPNPDFGFQVSTTQDANCGPLRAKFYYISPVNAQNFFWNFGSNDTLLTSNLDTISRIYNNETEAPFQNLVSVKAKSPSGCVTSKQTTFTVNPLVRARFNTSADSGCTPLRVVFEDSSTIASNVRRWIVNGVPIAGQQQQLIRTFTNNKLTDTIYTIKLAVRNNQGFNCVDTMIKRIKVYPKPRPNDLIVSPSEGCSPLKVTFRSNVENAVSYKWDFDDGSDTTVTVQQFSRNLFNTHPVNNKTHRVIRYSSSIKGCMDTTRTNVVVKPQTIALISVIKQSGCTPFTVQFSGMNSVNANGFVWNFGNGSPVNTSATPNYTFINNSDSIQKFTVRLIARKLQTNACPDTTTTIITVNPAPQANFGTNTNAGCGPLPIVLSNLSTGGISSYWVMSSGGISDTLKPDAQGKHDTIIDNPNFANKTIRVDQTVTTAFGCTAGKSQNIQIYPNLTAQFEVDSVGCQPHVVKFKNTSENFQGTYNWSFGNGSSSSDKNPIQIYDNYGGSDTLYKVTLTSTSRLGNCIRSSSVKIKVFAGPRANFRFLSDSSIQLPVNTVTIGNRTNYRSNWTYKWTFDDGTTDNNGSESFIHTFPLGNEDFIDTNFVVKMIAISPNGCSDTLSKTMVVKPGKPIAEFEATPKEGCRPLEVQFTSLSSFARKFEWSYVDKEGSPPIIITERNPVVFFESAGLKTVKLKVRGLGGRDSIEKVEYINVFETPRSSFYTDPTPPKTVVAPEQPAFFTPFENRPDYQYTWYFGDGDSATSRTAQHKYQDAGRYDITLKIIAPSGCISSDTIKAGVIARGEQILIAPTAFTPNPNGSNGGVIGGDGDNDVFYPFVQGVQYMTLQIFNRWGQPLFQTSELNHGWDGYFRGKIMPTDTYIYRIEAGFSNGETQIFLGDVTLIR